jgi:hypothetical protein
LFDRDKAASLPGENQTEINHEEHEGHEVFLFFMVFMPFMVEHFLARNARRCLSSYSIYFTR